MGLIGFFAACMGLVLGLWRVWVSECCLFMQGLQCFIDRCTGRGAQAE